MRIESSPEAGGSGSAPSARARRRGIDRVELVLLLLFGAMSMWLVALDLWQVFVHDRVWTGTDGFFIVDQMQYLAWIQSVSHHLLAANLFVLRPTPSDYFQPALEISGAIAALGVAPWLTLLLWKPVAVLGTFFATRAYAHRMVDRTGQRRAVIALGLFFGSFSLVYGSWGIVGDVMPGWLSWGYPFGLMAVALVIVALLVYDRARVGRAAVWVPGVLGGVASALHPWQGELLVLIVIGAELWRWRDHPRGRGLTLSVLTVVLTGLPLVYYLALGNLDLSWSLAREASKHTFSIGAIALAIGPLAAVAAVGYRGAPRNFLELVTRIWPLAAVLIYVLSATGLSATPLHAFNGITAPLAVLAVIGVARHDWSRVPRARLIGAVALGVATIPANAYAIMLAHTYSRPTPGNPNFITRDERDALVYLSRDPDDGGVLTPFYLGTTVPGRTGRRTLVGDCLWSQPACISQSEATSALFDGSMAAPQARRFVALSGARFVLVSCQPHVDMQRLLGPMVSALHRFGCAAVYDLGPANEP